MNKIQDNIKQLPHIIYKELDVFYLPMLKYKNDTLKGIREAELNENKFSEILKMPLDICCSESIFKNNQSLDYQKLLSTYHKNKPNKGTALNGFAKEIFYLRHRKVSSRYIINFLRHKYPNEEKLKNDIKNLVNQLDKTVKYYCIWYSIPERIANYYSDVQYALPIEGQVALNTYINGGQKAFINMYGHKDKYISERLNLEYNPSFMDTTHIEDTRPKIVTSTTPFIPPKKEKQKYEFKTKIPDIYFKTIDAYKNGVDIDINLLNKLKQNKFTIINELFRYKAKIMNEAVFYIGKPEYDRSETELDRIHKYVDETNAKINAYINKLNED